MLISKCNFFYTLSWHQQDWQFSVLELTTHHVPTVDAYGNGRGQSTHTGTGVGGHGQWLGYAMGHECGHGCGCKHGHGHWCWISCFLLQDNPWVEASIFVMTVIVNSDLCWAFGLISPSVLGEFPGVKYAKFQRSPDNREKCDLALCNEILPKSGS